ncbi:MAG: ABC transporter permease subunit [Pseudomonadales bacterium]|jgi:putrescine transport system permease protein|tara:strand:- start:91 stop:966 length:876 start_codon:yes stop_codon:yes gene_type:complete
MSWGWRSVIGVPYVWLTLFFLVPFVIVFKISFSEMAYAIPPYTDLMTWADQQLTLSLNFGNYSYLFTDDLYIRAYLSSIRIAGISTVICLLVAYPIAYAIARAEPATRNALLMLVILPSWTSFLIRIYAWVGILKNNGLINNFLMWLGIIDQPIAMLNTEFAVYIGIVYAYLPFMVLPLYTNLMKLDSSLLEAASDLGAAPWKVFMTVTLPLSKAGMIAGSMLVFIPAVGEFVIPDMLGGAETLMIGKVLWQEFFNNRDWPVASAVAIVMLLLLLLPITLFHRYQSRELGN